MVESFVMYKSYIDAARKFPKEKQLNFYDWIIDFAIYGIEPDFSSEPPELQFALDVVFGQIKTSVSASISRYEACVVNGKKGGRPKKENNLNNQTKNQSKNQTGNQRQNQTQNLNKNYNYNNNSLSVSEGGGLITSPPPHKGCERFQVKGKWYEEYIADDGEKRVRPIESFSPPPKGTLEYDRWRNQ